MTSSLAFGEAGPKCPACGKRKLRMRPYLADAVAVCIGCGEQFEGLNAGQEQLVQRGEEERAAAMTRAIAESIETVRRMTRRA